jgi:hypothetical protein
MSLLFSASRVYITSLADKSYRQVLQASLTDKSCRQVLQASLTGKSYRQVLQASLTDKSYRQVLQTTLTDKSYRQVLQTSLTDKSYRQVLTHVNNSRHLLRPTIFYKTRLVTFFFQYDKAKYHNWFLPERVKSESEYDLDSLFAIANDDCC